MEYECFEKDYIPVDVLYADMFSRGFYVNPKPNYAIEVDKNEDENLHPAYCYDAIPVAG